MYRNCINLETLKALVTPVKKRMWQKLKSLLWSSEAIVTSTSLSSADIFTSSSDLNSLPGQEVLTCSKCDKVYTFNFAVNKHIRNTHLEIEIMMMMMMILQSETLSLQGRLKVKITVKQTQISLLGHSILCMCCKKITVKLTQIRLLGQSILCLVC